MVLVVCPQIVSGPGVVARSPAERWLRGSRAEAARVYSRLPRSAWPARVESGSRRRRTASDLRAHRTSARRFAPRSGADRVRAPRSTLGPCLLLIVHRLWLALVGCVSRIAARDVRRETASDHAMYAVANGFCHGRCPAGRVHARQTFAPAFAQETHFRSSRRPRSIWVTGGPGRPPKGKRARGSARGQGSRARAASVDARSSFDAAFSPGVGAFPPVDGSKRAGVEEPGKALARPCSVVNHAECVRRDALLSTWVTSSSSKRRFRAWPRTPGSGDLMMVHFAVTSTITIHLVRHDPEGSRRSVVEADGRHGRRSAFFSSTGWRGIRSVHRSLRRRGSSAYDRFMEGSAALKRSLLLSVQVRPRDNVLNAARALCAVRFDRARPSHAARAPPPPTAIAECTDMARHSC